MTDIKEAVFLSTFPTVLKQDKNMYALGRLISEELHITANEMEKNIIYARIETLPETWLDMLAYDLHVDWYGYDYPIEIKRELLKNCVKVHKKLGTKYAVQTVLQDVYKTARIEEWFEYGGKPYTFRVSADVGNNGMTVDTSYEIERKMQFYKNLRSHCSGIFYSLSTEKAVASMGVAFKIHTSLKIKPLLDEKIKAAGGNIAGVCLQARDSMKIKSLIK